MNPGEGSKCSSGFKLISMDQSSLSYLGSDYFAFFCCTIYTFNLNKQYCNQVLELDEIVGPCFLVVLDIDLSNQNYSPCLSSVVNR